MDFRQNKEFNRWATKSGLFDEDTEVFDLVSQVGSSQRFMRQIAKKDSDALLEVQVFAELHKGKKLIMIHHSSCGAYNKWHGPLSPEEEKKRQLNDMEKVKKIIIKKYASLEVVKVWAELKDPVGDNIDFSIINED